MYCQIIDYCNVYLDILHYAMDWTSHLECLMMLSYGGLLYACKCGFFFAISLLKIVFRIYLKFNFFFKRWHLAQINPSTCYNYLQMHDFQRRFCVRKMFKRAFQNDLKCENPFNDITTLKFITIYGKLNCSHCRAKKNIMAQWNYNLLEMCLCFDI
jgi:hypothetical protein